jgi:hypothetical protein
MTTHTSPITHRGAVRACLPLLVLLAAGCSRGRGRRAPVDATSRKDAREVPADVAPGKAAGREAEETLTRVVAVKEAREHLPKPEWSSVSVTFGEDAEENGIRTRVWGKPGSETIATYAGKSGLQTDLVKGAWGIWGDVSDAFIHGGTNHVRMTIEYWDKRVAGDQCFKLYYDSVQKPMARAPSTFLEGGNTWKAATFLLEDAGFAGRQEGGADFRLFSTDTNMCVRSVTIEKVPDVVPTSAVSVVPESAGIVEGELKNLTVVFAPGYATDKFVTWRSSDPGVATVNALGQVVGVSAGKTDITATHERGIKGICTVTVAGVPGTGVVATRAGTFLDSIGVNSAISARGENLAKTIECIDYTGIRWIRSGLGLPMKDYVELNKATGVRFSLGFGGDIGRFVRGARKFADAGLLLAFEGPNEPNNWRVTYQGVQGGGSGSWVPVARFQRDFYAAVKSDPVLRDFPVWDLSEGGAEVDNVGMQFLAIPRGADIAMPDGTQYADYACCHNYCCHPSWPGLHDNQAWLSSDPTPKCPVDGLYIEYGRTWGKKYAGYSEAELLTLPRVTTETGITLSDTITEEVQARLYMHVYLSQFKQGWEWTSIYILRDRVDEGGNQTFGFFKPDYTPRKAAIYLHNLTTILADPGYIAVPGRLDYYIPNQPPAVHDMLLQKSDGRFCLVVWGERYASGGTDEVIVTLGRTVGTVTLYDPTVGTEPVRTLRDVDAVKLDLGTNAVIVELFTGPRLSVTAGTLKARTATDLDAVEPSPVESADDTGLKLLSHGLPTTSYTGGDAQSRGGNEPGRAFDGDMATAFCNGASYPAWIMVDLGAEFSVVKTMAFLEKPDVWYSYKVEVSPDGETWAMFADQTGNKEPSEDPAYTDLGDAVGRYVRFAMTDAPHRDRQWFWPVVMEFRVYGVPVGE